MHAEGMFRDGKTSAYDLNLTPRNSSNPRDSSIRKLELQRAANF
jgi:hypothetical protein